MPPHSRDRSEPGCNPMPGGAREARHLHSHPARHGAGACASGLAWPRCITPDLARVALLLPAPLFGGTA